ncbi:hypothetical protein JKP88DRAFT_256407 [Tribonema minus]|uniref:L-lactate dehydrogenase n=1 Tax=Tribonema minus TaxID=303371 RepID=A0A835Z626_9STRA|nr:hypothetical protein JKP88DRAFT_260740 [Tribonema minus]KAG5186367.1 hypothetical protein JKP88DRAFT_256407 [Tribonema minus]
MSKVTIVGVGSVGAACAMAIVAQRRCSELVLYDVNTDLVEGEAMDLQHAYAFHGVAVKAANGWQDTSGSDIIVITAGARQKPGESRLELNGRNAAIMKSIVPNLVMHSHTAVIIVVSNPCDVMAKMVHDMSFLPPGRVLGSGTYLDSSRFRSFVAKRLNVDPVHVHGLIVGEHGDSTEELCDMHSCVVSSAQDIIAKRGYTSSGIGFTVSRLVDKILRDSHSVVPVSTSVKGLFGITEDVFLSVPCVIGRSGVERVLQIQMSPEELQKLRDSATRIASA